MNTTRRVRDWPSTHSSLIRDIASPSNGPGWERFVARYGVHLKRFCRGLGLQESEAEETTQRVLYKLLEKMREFKYDRSRRFTAWLRTVTHHAAMDCFRERKQRDKATGSPNEFEHVIRYVTPPEKLDDLVKVLVLDLRRGILARAEQHTKRRIKNQKNWQSYLARKDGVPALHVAHELEMPVASVHKAFSDTKRMLRESIEELLGSDDSSIESVASIWSDDIPIEAREEAKRRLRQ